MKIVMVSNFLNHHQLPFCNEMQKITEGNFIFIATTKIPQQRLELGYRDINDAYDFVLCTYESPDYVKQAYRLINEADAVVIGSAPYCLVENRVEQGKLTFRYSERLFKNGYKSLLSPRAWYYQLRDNAVFRKNKLYMLCASAFTSMDYAYYLSFFNKAYKWGYFPEVKEYELNELMDRKKSSIVSILWVGRFVNFKNPQFAIMLAKRLKANHIFANIKMIGTGELLPKMLEEIRKEDLEEYVKILGAVSTEKVRENMEASEIFIFTSDKGEGWGAVLNESMNSGCAVLAGSAIGSVPFLVNDGINGLIYKDGDFEDFYAKMMMLINDSQLRQTLGEAAYYTMINEWNPQIVAERFVEMVETLKENREFNKYLSGPCSKAPWIKDGWYKNEKNMGWFFKVFSLKRNL